MIIRHGDNDITEFIASINWGGSKSEVARKLEITLANAPLDKNITPPDIKLSDPLVLLEDDGVTERFRGYVIDREASSTQGTISYVAYDLLFYTLKSTATYNFSGKTAEEITRMVCEDMGIPIGNLATTGIKQKLIVQGVTIYEIIMQAYTQAHEQNGKLYRVTASHGKLNVIEMGKVACEIEFTEDTNISASKYTETLANMVNKVRIYDESGNPIGVVQDDETYPKYGTFQQAYTKEEGKDATTTAKSLLHGIDKTFELDCLNYNEAVTGAGILVTDSTTQLSGITWIEADTHTWSNGVATMKVTLVLKQVMDAKEAKEGSGVIKETPESSNTDTTPKKTPPKTKTSEMIGMVGGKPTKRGSINNPPFAIVNKYGTKVYGDWTNYDQMVRFFFRLPDDKTGWTLVDKNGDEMKW